MNFAKLELSAEDLAFADEIRNLLLSYWNPEGAPLALDHHRAPAELGKALGKRGLLYPGLASEEGGAGLSPIRQHILNSVVSQLRVPHSGDQLIRPVLIKYGSERLKQEVLPRLAAGEVTVCLGYTEPDSGSDMAAARTRAVLNGDTWTINGSKIFTTWAEVSDYVFLLTRTNTSAPKHKGLTMFLVPLDLPGVEVRALHAMSEVRTNMTFYKDVQIPDWYRLGPVDGGWPVVSEPLAAEHGSEGPPDGLGPINGTMGAMFTETLERLLSVAGEWATADNDSRDSPRWQNPVIRAKLGEMLLDVEACMNYPSELGKVPSAEALMHHADVFADLVGLEGSLAESSSSTKAEFAFAWARGFAQGTGIYGGTTDIWRNNYARAVLSLPKQR